MNQPKKITDNDAFFIDFALFWVVFGWLAFASTLLDFFHAWIFISYSVLAGGYFIATLVKKRRILKFSVDFVVANILIFLTVFIFSFFVTPTVFTGRDQGSISNAAIELSQNHQLEFSTLASKEFFSIYGKGKALNFPGFYYTENGNLTTQFPLGYTSWLGAFYSIFGIYGLVIGNAVCLYLFLISLYVLGKKLLKIRYSALLLIFSITSFSFVWFFKFTLSENLALALLWTMILSVLYLKKSPSKKTLYLYLLSATLLAFTRIEGYAFLATSLFVLAFEKNFREFAIKNKKGLLIFFSFFLTAFILNFSKTIPFFTEMAKAFMNFISISQGNPPSSSDSAISSLLRILQLHAIYGLILFLFFGFFGIAKSLAEKSKLILIPLIITFPSLIYIVDSNISSDHPWMMRRFAFAVLPLFIFYTTYLLKIMFEKTPESARHPILAKYSAVAISILILAVNLNSFARYAFYSQDQNLLDQTRKLSENFSKNDLVLVDRLASNDGWSMINGPMQTIFGKQTAYLTNPSDIKKINTDKFENIYIITPSNNLAYYAGTEIGSQLKISEKYTLKTAKLVEKKNGYFSAIISYPEKENIEVNGYILKYEK